MPTPLHEFERLRPEMAQPRRRLVRDMGDKFPGIESASGTGGGDAVILRTRIPIWSLVQAHQAGVGEADLLRGYPSLRAEDLANAWAYCRANQAEIERQIAETENA